jgi:predicted nucleic acid-binding protein
MLVRVVFDTSAYIMAAGNRKGTAGQALLAARPGPAQLFELYTSKAILTEFEEIAVRVLKWDEAVTHRFVEDTLITIASVVEPRETLDVVKRDPDDNAILECAVAVFFMPAKDWRHLYEKYKGQRVALGDDEVTVIAAGRTLEEAQTEAEQAGVLHPIFTKVPVNLTFIG